MNSHQKNFTKVDVLVDVMLMFKLKRGNVSSQLLNLLNQTGAQG